MEFDEGSSQPQIPGGFEPEEEEPTFPAGMFPQEEEELQYADPQERDSSHSEHTEQHYTGSERSSGSGPTESSNGDSGSAKTTTSRVPSEHPSEREVEQNLSALVEQGGVEFLNHLLAKAVSSDSESLDASNVREWSFKDIMRMSPAQQKEWKVACKQELDSLRARDVYDIVDPPPGRKIIKNRWVFDVKSDGRKKARLVTKGFSQVEGIDFDVHNYSN
jgi:Reverse transcriptase (RNA-dependent DNA polymerase)